MLWNIHRSIVDLISAQSLMWSKLSVLCIYTLNILNVLVREVGKGILFIFDCTLDLSPVAYYTFSFPGHCELLVPISFSMESVYIKHTVYKSYYRRVDYHRFLKNCVCHVTFSNFVLCHRSARSQVVNVIWQNTTEINYSKFY